MSAFCRRCFVQALPYSSTALFRHVCLLQALPCSGTALCRHIHEMFYANTDFILQTHSSCCFAHAVIARCCLRRPKKRVAISAHKADSFQLNYIQSCKLQETNMQLAPKIIPAVICFTTFAEVNLALFLKPARHQFMLGNTPATTWWHVVQAGCPIHSIVVKATTNTERSSLVLNCM